LSGFCYFLLLLLLFLEIEGGADWKNQIYTEEDEKCFVSELKTIKIKK